MVFSFLYPLVEPSTGLPPRARTLFRLFPVVRRSYFFFLVSSPPLLPFLRLRCNLTRWYVLSSPASRLPPWQVATPNDQDNLPLFLKHPPHQIRKQAPPTDIGASHFFFFFFFFSILELDTYLAENTLLFSGHLAFFCTNLPDHYTHLEIRPHSFCYPSPEVFSRPGIFFWSSGHLRGSFPRNYFFFET